MFQKERIYTSASRAAFKSKAKLQTTSFKVTILKQAIVFACNYLSHL